jgi:hypothetical protein
VDLVRQLALGLALAALGAAPLAAQQQVCTSNLSTPHAPPSWATTFPVPRFDPAFGTLQEVQLNLSASVEGWVRIENLSPIPVTYQVELSALISLRLPDQTVVLTTQPAGSVHVLLAAFDGLVDFGGGSGVALYLLGSTGGISTTLAAPAELANFLGPGGASGTVQLPVDAYSTSFASGPGVPAVVFEPNASAGLRVCYRYAVPAPFCAGDGTGASCPCGNHSAIGLDAGCLNSLGLAGRLTATGTTSLAQDLLRLQADSLPPGVPALFVQGTARESGGAGSPFGDGLRCAGGMLVRLATKRAAGGSCAYPDPGDASISVRGLVAAPGLRTYQVWYRNAAPFCASDGFNLTQGLAVNWLP